MYLLSVFTGNISMEDCYFKNKEITLIKANCTILVYDIHCMRTVSEQKLDSGKTKPDIDCRANY